MTRIETTGSIWLIDDDRHVYYRFPREERPRERPEWGGPDAGALQDAVPHDFVEWWIDPPTGHRPAALRIRTTPGDNGRCVWAPNPEILS